MVGLDAAGKTTILYKLKLGEIVTTIPTIGNITFLTPLLLSPLPISFHNLTSYEWKNMKPNHLKEVLLSSYFVIITCCRV